MDSPSLVLKKGREKSVFRKHPWIFTGSIDKVLGNPENGQTVNILTAEMDIIALGAYSSQSQICARIWTWDITKNIDSTFIHDLVNEADHIRDELFCGKKISAYRIINGESDQFPGLIVDRYGDVLVAQFLSMGAEYWKNDIVQALIELSDVKSIFERSDVDIRQLEGLPSYAGILYGPDPIENILIDENGIKFYVDIRLGHKTGFYLDQRINRKIVRGISENKHVLDCFSYTGGFSINALLGGAISVTAIENSLEAIELMNKNILENNLDINNLESVQGDVFQILRKYRDMDRKFDLIILDPPKFARSFSQVEKASRGYKDINLLALKLLQPGGILVTFSCSGSISIDLFQKILAGAALDAGIDAQILRHLYQAEDHPIGLNFPEGLYLKGLMIRKG